MVGHLMILGNPKKKKRAKRRKPMTAKQLQYFGPRKARKAAKKKRVLKKRAKGETVIIATSNPKRRARVAKRRKRRVIRSRRNPRVTGGGMGGYLANTLMGAAIGASGALAVDLAIGNLPIPARFKQGAMLPLIRIGAGLLVGAGLGAIAGAEVGEQAAAGAMIVTAYQYAKTYINQNFENVKLARYVSMNRYLGRRRRPVRRRNRRMGAAPFKKRAGIVRNWNGPRALQHRAHRRQLVGGGFLGAAPPNMHERRRWFFAQKHPNAPYVAGMGRRHHKVKRHKRHGKLGYIGPGRTLGRYVNN